MIYPDKQFKDYLIPERFQGNCRIIPLPDIANIHSLSPHKTKVTFLAFYAKQPQTDNITDRLSTRFFASGHSTYQPMKNRNTTHCLTKRKPRSEEKMPPRWQNRFF